MIGVVREAGIGAAVTAILGAGLVLLGPGADPRPEDLPIESKRYLKMAGWDRGSLLPEPNFPSRYRILSPLLVRALPLSPEVGFQLLTLVSLSLSCLLLRRLLLRLGFREDQALWGIALGVTVFYPTLYYLRTPFMSDPLFFVFWTGGLLMALEGREAMLAGWVALGVLNKETAVFLVPTCLVLWFERDRPWRGPLRAALVAAPALLVYLGLRSFYAYPGPHAPLTPDAVARWVTGLLDAPGLGRRLASGFLLAAGPCWAYASELRGASPTLRRLILGGFLSVLPLLALAGDSGRQLAKLLPFWTPAVLHWASARAESRIRSLFLVVLGNWLLALGALAILSPAGEVALRVAGVALSLAPLAWALRGRRP